MQGTRSSRSVLGRWLLLLGLGIVVAPGGSDGVAQVRPIEGTPAAKLTVAQQDRRLQERDGHRKEALRLANSGRLDDAVREAEAALAIERERLGELSEDVAQALGFLSRLHEDRGDWAAAR